ncbi:predicted protein [Naegleria gruberi]|uniref:Predicted protein n=1 Tax=Naegleria gruberi TaxID=5762 RepID=D2VZ11_NAEGR|nr:uncharacterized protein NAEGRDRAFT_74316 [Naegleria gruberi]EFC37909.1 predicted protein [Naegleria gruberi]|eukprot:XP_002670653.1 predicted protein [Naegleria gruberi strain NEG-M]
MAIRNHGCDLIIRTIFHSTNNQYNDNDFQIVELEHIDTTTQFLTKHFQETTTRQLSSLLFKYEHLEKVLASRNPIRYLQENPLPDAHCPLICYKLIHHNGNLLQFAGDKIRNNEEMVILAARSNAVAVSFASDELKRNREFAKVAILKGKSPYWGRSINCTFEFLENFHDDEEIALIAIDCQRLSYKFLSERLKMKRIFIDKAISNNGTMIEFVPKQFINRELILKAIKSTKHKKEEILRFIPEEFKFDKEIILQIVRNCLVFRYIPEKLRNDRDVILQFVKSNKGDTLQYVNDKFKSDREIVMESVKQNGCNLAYSHESLKNDKEIVTLAIRNNIEAIKHASDDLKFDKELLMSSITSTECFLKFLTCVNPIIQYDDEFIIELISDHTRFGEERGFDIKKIKEKFQMKMIEIDPTFIYKAKLEEPTFSSLIDREHILQLLEYQPSSFVHHQDPIFEKFKSDREIVRRAIQLCPSSLTFASKEIQNDREFIKEAIQYHYNNFKYASKELQNDIELINQVIERRGSYFIHISDETLKNDRNLFLKAARNTYHDIYENIGDELAHDRDLALEYTKQVETIASLPFDFKHDREIVEIAIQMSSTEYEQASYELKNDREIVLMTLKANANTSVSLSDIVYRPLDWEICYEACKANGKNLQSVPSQYQDDEEIVQVAIDTDWTGEYFEFASNRLKSDKNFVSKLMDINPLIYCFISHELRSDRELAIKAISKKGEVLQYCSSEYQNDREIVLKAVDNYPNAFYCSSKELQINDSEIFETAIRNGLSIHTNEETYFQSFITKEMALQAIENKFKFNQLQFNMRNDYEIALKAVNKNMDNLKWTSMKLNKKFLLEIQPMEYNLINIPLKFRNDREIALKSMQTHGDSFILLSRELQLEFSHDRQIMLMAVKSSSSIFSHACKELQQDYQFISQCIELNGQVLKYLISTPYYLDRNLVLKAVQFPHTLLFIPLEYLKDREINLTAVKSCKESIISCTYDMKCDWEIALSSLSSDICDTIVYLPYELRSNREFISKCMEINKESIVYANYSLRYDREFLKELNEKYDLVTNPSFDLRKSIDFKYLVDLVSKV